MNALSSTAPPAHIPFASGNRHYTLEATGPTQRMAICIDCGGWLLVDADDDRRAIDAAMRRHRELYCRRLP